MSMHDYIARAYEKQCEMAMRAVEFMPPYVPPVLTPKQKIEREIRYRKRLLGKLLYKISNRLGYYDDEY
jgi:hypothetical protein